MPVVFEMRRLQHRISEAIDRYTNIHKSRVNLTSSVLIPSLKPNRFSDRTLNFSTPFLLLIINSGFMIPNFKQCRNFTVVKHLLIICQWSRVAISSQISFIVYSLMLSQQGSFFMFNVLKLVTISCSWVSSRNIVFCN